MPSFTLGFRQVGKVELRRDKRFHGPTFTVEVGDYRYETVNWSLGGLLLRNYEGRFFSNMPLLVHISVKNPARDRKTLETLTIEARVVRNDQHKRLLALKFVKLTPQMIKFLERAYITHKRQIG
nr:PilZ domain-containing protein [uncultured Dongia sp.]